MVTGVINMPQIRVELTEENHKKLNILCVLYKKTQDEIINLLLSKAKIPGESLDFIVAGEKIESMKTEPKIQETKIDVITD